MLDDSIRGSKQVRSSRVTEVVIKTSAAGGNGLLSKARHIPDTNGLIERGRRYEIFSRMELSAHHVVIVTSEDTEGREREKVREGRERGGEGREGEGRERGGEGREGKGREREEVRDGEGEGRERVGGGEGEMVGKGEMEREREGGERKGRKRRGRTLPDTCSRLPVPNSYSLIIRGTNYPGVLL